MDDQNAAESESIRLEKTRYLPLKIEIARALQSAAETYRQNLLEAAKVLQPFKEEMRRSLQDLARHIAPALETIALVMRELPERTRTHLAALASQGWYLDPGMDMDQLANYQRLFAEKGAEAA